MRKLLRNSLVVLFLLAIPVFAVSANSVGTTFQSELGKTAQPTAWQTVQPTVRVTGQPTGQPTNPSDLLCGDMTAMDGVGERIDAIAAFNFDPSLVDESALSEFDKMFIVHGIVGNTLEIQTLTIARDRVQNEEFACAIDMMIAMHSMDLEVLTALAERLNIDTSVDMTSVPVYPQTPDYNLGMRTVNVVEKFLTPLRNEDVEDFDALALHIIKQEHAMLEEISLTAQRLVTDTEVKAFAMHTADAVKLHIILLDDLANRVYLNIHTPVSFQETYMDPHQVLGHK